MTAAGPGSSAQRQRERLTRGARVRKRPEYLAIQNGGRRVSGPHLLLFARAGAGAGRIGVTVSRKVGNAVLRNRLKRWIRECYRQRRADLPPGIDLVVVARPPAASANFAILCSEITGLAGRFRSGGFRRS